MRVLLVAVVGASGACYDRSLEGQELTTLFRDSTVRGVHEMDGYSFVRQYNRDGTFTQQFGKPSPASGRWHVSSSSICIRWDRPHPKAGRQFCRSVRTDDEGNYWKELPHNNVVQYSSILSPDGQERMFRPAASTRRWRWMKTWRGWLVGIGLGVFLYVLWRRYQAGFLMIGGIRYKKRDLRSFQVSELLTLLWTCVCEAADEQRDFILNELFLSSRHSQDQVHTAFFDFFRPYTDEALSSLLAAAVGPLGEPQQVLCASNREVRFAYLVGKANADEAVRYQSSSEYLFDKYKADALEYLEHARSHVPPPNPELVARNPYRENPYAKADKPDYSVLVGAVYEAITYAKYTPPAASKRSYSSSSYSGGG